MTPWYGDAGDSGIDIGRDEHQRVQLELYAGGETVGIVQDRPEELRRLLAEALQDLDQAHPPAQERTAYELGVPACGEDIGGGIRCVLPAKHSDGCVPF